MDREKKLALYLASVIIGVGVLELPVATARCGVLPLVLFLTLMAYVTALIYDRIVEVSKAYGFSQYALHHAAIASGLRISTRLSLTLGLFLYALSADVAYILISTSSILSLKGIINRALVGVLIIIASLPLYRNPRLFKTVILLGFRCLIIAYSRSRVEASLLYLLTILFAEAFPDRGRKEVIEEAEEILPRHYLGVIYTLAKIAVLVSATLVATILIASRSGFAFDTPRLPKSIEDVYYAFGLSIFAFLGTGVCNALVYKRYKGKVARRVNLLSVTLVLLVYLFFIFSIVAVVPYEVLYHEDVSYGHALLAIAEVLSSMGLSSFSKSIIALANVFAILTITTAFLGMTDASAERMDVEGIDYRISRIFTAVIAYVIALCIHELSLSFSVTFLLGLAGALGGGISLLVFPRLVGKPNRKAYALGSVSLALYFIYLIRAATTPEEMKLSVAFFVIFIVIDAVMAYESVKRSRFNI